VSEARTVLVGMRLPVNLIERLRKIAASENNGVSAVCRRLLSVALETEGRSAAVDRHHRGVSQ
jgi:hypothetical protein